MSEFIDLTGTEGLEEGAMRVAELDGHVLLVAHVGGKYYVTDARCPHLGGHLENGVLEGTVVTCPRHHSQFDLTDGRVVRWTGWTGVVKSVAELARHPRPLRTYEVKVEAGRVLVGPQNEPPVS